MGFRERIKAAILFMAMLVFTLSCTAESRAVHFNRLASNGESQSDRVVRSLGLKGSETVADIGSGGGHFTVLLARAVGPRGRVYAVDIDRELLGTVGDLVKKEGLANVTTLLAAESGTGLPEGSVDLVFMRNVFHDLKDNRRYFIAMRSLLRPGGRVAVIDYRPDSPLQRLWGHFIDEEAVVSMMESAGYRRVERLTFLASQHFNVFIVPAGGEAR